MVGEIGSEFHKMVSDAGRGLTYPVPGSLVFSGRTAIETVLKELPKARSAILPSYCCDSMIQPFRDAGIKVDFYPVEFHDELKIEMKSVETDIILICNYFGFDTPMPNLNGFDGVVIEDISHSLLSARSYHPRSNYLVASVRKWEPINCGGYCAAINEDLHHVPTAIPPDIFIAEKNFAMELKTEYLDDLDEGKKTRFLFMFEDSNKWLSANYSGLSIDAISRDYLSNVDLKKQQEIRRKNALTLYKGLRDRVEFLFREEDMECPLFVPILLPNRDEVRRTLIENKIYCPIHWPKPVDAESNLYDQELSLICDQRYNEADMERIVVILKSLL